VGRQAAVVRLVVELLPGGVVLIAAWGLLQSVTAQAALVPAAPYFCFGALAAALFLTWYYDQSRLLYCAAVVALTVVAFDQPSFEWTALPLTAAILLPVNFVLFGLIKERGVMTFDGLVEAGVVVAQVVGMPWLAGQSGFLEWGTGSASGLPWMAQWSFLLAGAAILALILRRRGTLEKGMLWALAAMFIGLHQRTGTALWFYAGIAGLFLAYAVLEHGRDLAFRDDLTGFLIVNGIDRLVVAVGVEIRIVTVGWIPEAIVPVIISAAENGEARVVVCPPGAVAVNAIPFVVISPLGMIGLPARIRLPPILRLPICVFPIGVVFPVWIVLPILPVVHRVGCVGDVLIVNDYCGVGHHRWAVRRLDL
jgi:hypothetical protein